MKSTAQDAISAALSGDWSAAIEINLQLIKETPKNTEALNRLAKAYWESGDSTKAKKYTKKVLDIDPYNKIALKAILKFKNQKAKKSGKITAPQAFLEEPGKTKIVNLINLGNDKIITQLDAGEKLELNPSHRMTLRTTDGQHVGRLSDDLSAHLRKLIKLGNKYDCFVKSADPACVKVFIKETMRSEKLKNVPSFSAEKVNYVAFTPPELLRKKDTIADMTPDSEEA